jgi:ABC-2 type transport system ATP-binding protein
MRELIRRYGASGSTVLVSSHQLAEVQLMCDSVAIINRGRLISSGRVSDVLASRGGVLVVTIDDAPGALAVLNSQGFSGRLGDEPNTVLVEAGGVQAASVTEALANDGRFLRGLRLDSASLESIFLELTAAAEDER